jgi:hypothetical protein
MEKVSPKYMIALIKKIEKVLQNDYNDEDVRAYLERWQDDYGINGSDFYMCVDNDNTFNLKKTLQNINDEKLIKIAVDLEIETPDFIPSIPHFKNEIKSSYQTAAKTFELAFRKVYAEPNIAVSLANSALESVMKEILQSERITNIQYCEKDTLETLVKKCLTAFELFPYNDGNIPKDIKQLGSGLIKSCQAVENLRSARTLAHGKTDNDIIIDDPILALFIVNAVSTIGLFFVNLYRCFYHEKVSDSLDEMPF